MQTFLPYSDFVKTSRILDNKRLGKQRVEAFQILNALYDKTSSWCSHPAVRMWRGYTRALQGYINAMLSEWENRGFKNTMKYYNPKITKYPDWLGDKRLHYSHRCNLLRKNFDYYSEYFSPLNHDINAPYYWPVKLKTQKLQDEIYCYYKNF